MAEQSSHDVVNQTLSGGEPLPSDVPASANVKNTAGGDVGETGYTTTKMSYDQSRDAHHHHYGHANNMQDPNYAGRDNGASATVSVGVCGVEDNACQVHQLNERLCGFLGSRTGCVKSTRHERTNGVVRWWGGYGFARWFRVGC